MGKLLGLDYGEKTVGVALCDTSASVPMPLETIRRERENHLRKTLTRIEELIFETKVHAIVVGLPLNMDGSEGERAEKARSFADKLTRRTGLPVYMQDERLTSVDAEKYIRENYADGAKKARKVKEEVDAVAAALILEDYLGKGKDDDKNII
ncbi:MAG: Holliday junction resolvase RuvX [Lachnospiraceae bacterium]|nr:Holliday junction resolvase RuvX [Lachnospiraceae bacterium]